MNKMQAKSLNYSKKKKRSYKREDLQKIAMLLSEKLPDILEYFQVEYRVNGEMAVGRCPVHDGDNDHAFNIYLEPSEEYPQPGNWNCWTSRCHENWKPDVFGFVQAMLTRIKGKEVSFIQGVDWICSFLGIDQNGLKSISLVGDIEKSRYLNAMSNLKKQAAHQKGLVEREKVRKYLQIPSDYYMDRGYSSGILDKYDVGLSRTNKTKDRVVVPVYDEDYTGMIGFTARTIHEGVKPKWVHQPGFKTKHCLYNYWFAKKHIAKKGAVILVEGPGDVWRLEEGGIKISVAVFGTSLSEEQMTILERSGASSIIVMMDNDEAGIQAAKKIQERCRRLFRVYFPKISASDIGDMAADDVTHDIKPIIDEVMKV